MEQVCFEATNRLDLNQANAHVNIAGNFRFRYAQAATGQLCLPMNFRDVGRHGGGFLSG